MKVYGQLIEAQVEILSSEPTSKVGRLIWDTSTNSLKVGTGSSWTTIGIAAASGGTAVNWFAASGAPYEDEDNNQKIYKYEAGLTQDLVMFYKVPKNYVAGTQIQLLIGVYSPSTSGTVQMDAVSTLIRKDTDSIDSTTLQHTKNGNSLTNTTANQMRQVTIDITDSSGQIASTAVSGGDLIKVQLRRGTDTDTAEVAFVPNYTEVTL